MIGLTGGCGTFDRFDMKLTMRDRVSAAGPLVKLFYVCKIVDKRGL